MTVHNIEAVQAAAKAVLPELTARIGSKRATRTLAFDLACAAVDAASPVIANQTFEVMEAAVLAEVGAVTDKVMVARRDEMEAAVRADERETIARLAEERGAVWIRHVPCGCDDPGCTALAARHEPFADLLREQP